MLRVRPIKGHTNELGKRASRSRKAATYLTHREPLCPRELWRSITICYDVIQGKTSKYGWLMDNSWEHIHRQIVLVFTRIQIIYHIFTRKTIRTIPHKITHPTKKTTFLQYCLALYLHIFLEHLPRNPSSRFYHLEDDYTKQTYFTQYLTKVEFFTAPAWHPHFVIQTLI